MVEYRSSVVTTGFTAHKKMILNGAGLRDASNTIK